MGDILPFSWIGTAGFWKSGRVGHQSAAFLLSYDLSRSCWQSSGHMYPFPCLCTGTSALHGFAASAHKNKTSRLRTSHSTEIDLCEYGPS